MHEPICRWACAALPAAVRSGRACKGEGVLQVGEAGGAVGKDISVWDRALMLFAWVEEEKSFF